MSGLEGAALALGPKLLAPVAAKAATALNRRALFRWRVSRRAEKAVGFWVPGRRYRKWAKTLTEADIAQPVEDVAGDLAVRLDGVLCEASPKWAEAADHLSRALLLVEQTFPAIAAELKESDYRQLTERWAQERSSRSRELLFELTGPDAGLSGPDLAAVLLRRSVARRAVRLQATGLTEDNLAEYFARMQTPEVPDGALRVLVGDFGAGKSEKAESWHRECISLLSEGDERALPAWVSARDLNGPAFEGALDGQVGKAWRSGRGACLVVDGLDETDVAAAQAMLENARLLVRSYDHVRVLLTARPGVLSPNDEEEVEVALLETNEAMSLVHLAGGNDQTTWSWAAGMRESVRRPFFALAAGTLMSTEQAPRNEADFIRALVEKALADGPDRSVVTTAEPYRVLKRLAVALTDGDGSSRLTFSERQVARSSTLVADGPDDSVRFSLPIFQQWFAAQAMLDGDVSSTRVTDDLVSFERWRWASAVAALSVTESVVDTLIGGWVRGNPGVAGWILHQAYGSGRVWRNRTEPLETTGGGERLLKALRTWADSLGGWGRHALPPIIADGPFGLGVRIVGHGVVVALSENLTSDDYVAALPTDIHPLAGMTHSGWRPWFSTPAPEGPAWPWLLARDQVAKHASSSLERRPYLGGPGSIWQEERFYDVARQITGRGSAQDEPVPTTEIRAAATAMLERVNPNGVIRVNSQTYEAEELVDLVAHLDARGHEELECPLPTKDITRLAGNWVWDFYSPQRLMELEVEAYGRACVAYEQAMTTTFAAFAWSMQGAAISPTGALLELHFTNEGRARTPGLTVIRMPLDLLHEMAPTGPDVRWSKTGRAVISQAPDDDSTSWARNRERMQRVWAWLADNQIESLHTTGWSSTGADDMAPRRPSVRLAAQWLFDDLKALGLAGGTAPQFYLL